jgi:hypothetical protein
MHRTLVVLLAVAASAAAQHNLTLNGDFERNTTAECDFNLSNLAFTANMPACQGFGTTQAGNGEIDVMEASCGYGPPAPSGVTKVGIAANGDGSGFDAFSIRLGGPLVAGASYRLTFQAYAHVSDFSPQVGAVQVGLSQGAAQFGVQVAEFVPSPVTWSAFDGVIVPQSAATYLTVRYDETSDGWNHVDNFRLVPVAASGLDLGVSTSSIHIAGAAPAAPVAVLVSTTPTAGGGAAWHGMHLSLMPPVALAALLVADGTGSAACDASLPSGVTLLFQAVDFTGGKVSSVVALNAFESTPGALVPPPAGGAQPDPSKASPPIGN